MKSIFLLFIISFLSVLNPLLAAENCTSFINKAKAISNSEHVSIIVDAYLIRPSIETENEHIEKIKNDISGAILISNKKIVSVVEAKDCSQKIINYFSTEHKVTLINLKGKFLMPGLHDLHIHNYGMNADMSNTPIFEKDGKAVEHLDFPGLAAMNYRLLYSGVTSHLDLMSFNDETHAFRNRQRAYQSGLLKKDSQYLPTSHIYMTGGLFTVEGGHHGDLTWMVGKEKETTIFLSKKDIVLQKSKKKRLKELRKILNRHISKYNPKALKVSYDHNPHRPGSPKIFGLSRKVLGEFIQVAKNIKPGIKTVCHVGIWQDVRDCMDMGAEAITHLPFSKENDSAYKIPAGIIDEMKAKNLTVIPTMTVYMEGGFIKNSLFDTTKNTVTCEAVEEDCTCSNKVCTKTFEIGMTNGNTHFFNDPLLNEVTPKALLDHYFIFEPFSGNKWIDWAVNHNKMGYRQKTFRKLMNAGVRVILGTDTMWEGTFFGFSTHRELELMALSNYAVEVPFKRVTNMEILKTGTANAHGFLEHMRGQIIPGFMADFLVLNSSPINDIKNTRDISDVFSNGELVDRAILKEKMAVD